jgi:hypothetical protein
MIPFDVAVLTVFLHTCHGHVGKLMAYVWWFISCYSFAQWISGSYWWLAMYNWFIFLELKAYAVLSSLFSWRHTVELQQKCLVRFVVGWLHTFLVCVYYTGLTKSYWGFSNHTHTKLCQYHLVKRVTFLLVTGYLCDLFRSHIQSKGIFSWTTYKTQNIF